MRSVVVLPQPDGPSSAKKLPRSISSERSSTAVVSSKRLVTCSSVTSAAMASVDLRHDVLDLRVVLERVHREVLAVAGLLVAAVRHLRDQRDVVVDPHGPELELARRIQGAAHVARPDRRGQAVLDVVGPRDGLVVRGPALDGDDGTEDLALDDL